MDCDGKSESSPEREAGDDETKGIEGTDAIKKRKRKPYRPGRVYQLVSLSVCLSLFLPLPLLKCVLVFCLCVCKCIM
jgi:hypothetical protein